MTQAPRFSRWSVLLPDESVVARLLRHCLSVLSEREQLILDTRIGIAADDAGALAGLSRQLDLTPQRLQQLEREACARIGLGYAGRLIRDHFAALDALSAAGDGLLVLDRVLAELDPAAHRYPDEQVRLQYDVLVFLARFDDSLIHLPTTMLLADRRRLGEQRRRQLLDRHQQLLGAAQSGGFPALQQRLNQPDDLQLPEPLLNSLLQSVQLLAPQLKEDARRQAEEDARRQAEEDARRQAEEDARRQAEEDARRTRGRDDYDWWNRAIITYVTESVPPDGFVYLSVDDEILRAIRQRITYERGKPVSDFVDAVRRRVLPYRAFDPRTFDLRSIKGIDTDGYPRSAAFLAAEVLAASRMQEDQADAVASNDFFTRFRDVFSLPGSGRPDSLQRDEEESLWLAWNAWLRSKGYGVTAKAGEGTRRLINYPISQALLRGTDRDQLRALFRAKNWSPDLDALTLLQLIRAEKQSLTVHLRELLADQTPRQQAIATAMHDVFTTLDEGADGLRVRGLGRLPYAALLRSEDISFGHIRYWLLPRAARYNPTERLTVAFDGRMETTRLDRPRYRYDALIELTSDQLNGGLRLPLVDHPLDDLLVLPQRQFWVIHPDPTGEDGDWTSIGNVAIDAPFIVLCRAALQADMQQLYDEELLTWSAGPVALPGYADWYEYRNCRIHSRALDAANLRNRELQAALRPNSGLSIGLSGGIQLPGSGWLDGHGPQITVFTIHQQLVEVVIRDITLDQKLTVIRQQSHEPFTTKWPRPGSYRIEAAVAGERTSRQLQIVHLDEVYAVQQPDPIWRSIGGSVVSGALIGEQAEDDDAALV